MSDATFAVHAYGGARTKIEVLAVRSAIAVVALVFGLAVGLALKPVAVYLAMGGSSATGFARILGVVTAAAMLTGPAGVLVLQLTKFMNGELDRARIGARFLRRNELEAFAVSGAMFGAVLAFGVPGLTWNFCALWTVALILSLLWVVNYHRLETFARLRDIDL